MTTSGAVTTVPDDAADARGRARWLRTALLILLVMLVVALLVMTAIPGLSADPMAGT